MARFAKRDDVSDDQFDFLVTATPQEVRDLIATARLFHAGRAHRRAGLSTTKKRVTVSVDPGPQTTISSVSLTFKRRRD